MQINCKLSARLASLEIEQRKTHSEKELAKLFGTTKRYIKSLLNDDVRTINLNVLENILIFFHEQGYYYTLNDLFTLESSGVGTPSNKRV